MLLLALQSSHVFVVICFTCSLVIVNVVICCQYWASCSCD